MKKLFYFFFAAVIALAATGCSSCNKDEVKVLDFEECYMYAYNDMLIDQPDNSFKFYFATAWLDKRFTEIASSKDVTIDSVRVLFQMEPKIVKDYKFYTDGRIVMDTINGTWMECMDIDPDEVCRTLNEAIDMLAESNCIKPHSRVVVMRCPLYPPFNIHPTYLFGNTFELVSINSCDTVETPNE